MVEKDIYKKLDEINVVTPGLFNKFFEFVSHLEVSGNDPILITGPTGVGKSLFINIVKKSLDNVDNFIMVNCAHFDLKLAESELFGYSVGAFTGAIKAKEGLIKRADGKTLILDEIGELPKNVQAKLLMFLELGVFLPIGSKKEEGSNARIIGVTSRKSRLRKDFFHRFFEFSIPPLHERRMDVLYYIAMKYPEYIEMLTPSDILILLLNNWTGNLREVNNVVSMIQRRETKRKVLGSFYGRQKSKPDQQGRFFEDYGFDENESLLRGLRSINTTFGKSKIDEKRFELFLNRFGLGLDLRNSKKVFEGFIKKELKEKKKKFEEHMLSPSLLKFNMKIPEKYGVKLVVNDSPFYKVEDGFTIFCSLFFQDPCGDKNVLDISEGSSVAFPSLNYPIIDFYGKKIGPETINAWGHNVFECLSGIKLPGDMNLMVRNHQRVSIFSKVLLEYPDNRFLGSLAQKRLIDLPLEYSGDKDDYWSWEYDKFQKYYLKTLVEKHDWDVAKAARSVNLIPNSLRSKLKKYNIKRPEIK